MSVCDKWETVLPFISKDEFIGYKSTDPSGCFRRSREQLNKAGYDLKSPGWSSKMIAAGAIYQTYLTEDVGKMKAGYQKDQFEKGVEYLKTAMIGRIPVMCGVERYDGSSSGDKVTDHYVTFVGMGNDEGGKFFWFYDNATSFEDWGTSYKNKIYCDCTNYSLKGGGEEKIKYIGEGGVYIISQIRESIKLVKKAARKK